MSGVGTHEMHEPQITSWKALVTIFLAASAGFLTFNFQYIIKAAHIHVSLAHHHRTTAFCAFTGCKLSTLKQDVLLETAAPTKSPAQLQLENVTRILAMRVCGQPAIDGYAHVVPKCLEDSPTNRWWQEYYAKGGLQGDLVAHLEEAADYDGLAVFWGIGNKKKNAQECADHCLRHLPKTQGGTVGGPYENLPCNAFAFCPEDVCFEPDAHKHTQGDCWLKFTEGPAFPEVNMRGDLPSEFLARHPSSPKRVQWIAGVLLPPGVRPTNGTYGPRWKW